MPTDVIMIRKRHGFVLLPVTYTGTEVLGQELIKNEQGEYTVTHEFSVDLYKYLKSIGLNVEYGGLDDS